MDARSPELVDAVALHHQAVHVGMGGPRACPRRLGGSEHGTGDRVVRETLSAERVPGVAQVLDGERRIGECRPATASARAVPRDTPLPARVAVECHPRTAGDQGECAQQGGDDGVNELQA